MAVEDVASLIASRASISRDCLVDSNSIYSELPKLCRGSPLAATLLGGLLASPTFVLSRYLGPCGFRGSTDDVIVDWSKVNLAFWYTYESVDEVSASLLQFYANFSAIAYYFDSLPRGERICYKMNTCTHN